MIFGIGPSDSPRILNVIDDTFWINMIQAASRFICVVIENITTNAAQLSMGTTPGGTDIFASLPIPPKVGDKNGLVTVNIDNVFDLHNALSVFLHHLGVGDAFNGANLNFIFLFQGV
jgi:hypothetical protein